MTNTDKKSNKKSLKGWVIFAIIFIGLTLPFHYVPSRFKVFPKNTLTFSHTLILQSDIDNLLEQYNNASFFEKLAIKKDPFFRKLAEKGIIFEVKDK